MYHLSSEVNSVFYQRYVKFINFLYILSNNIDFCILACTIFLEILSKIGCLSLAATVPELPKLDFY